MSTAHGVELHCTVDAPHRALEADSFYRIIRMGATIDLRWGRRGQPGRTDHFTLASEPLAIDWLANTMSRYRSKHNYTMAYTTGPLGTAQAQADPEAWFLSLWRDAAVRSLSGGAPPIGHPRNRPAHIPPRNTWAVVTGLLELRGKDTGVDAMYHYLTSHPHAIDPRSDTSTSRIIAPIGSLPAATKLVDSGLWSGFQSSYTDQDERVANGSHITARELGPIPLSCPHAAPMCARCIQRSADLIVFLLRGQRLGSATLDLRLSIADAAHRLLWAPHRSKELVP